MANPVTSSGMRALYFSGVGRSAGGLRRELGDGSWEIGKKNGGHRPPYDGHDGIVFIVGR